MFIIKIQGGIGNQVLQYSFGRVLEIIYKKKVAYDLSFFETETKYTKRPYLLDAFKTKLRIATKGEIEHVRYPYGVISRVLEFMYKVLNKLFFKKYYIGYDEGLLPLLTKKETAYLEGFWQSYVYYAPIVEVLREEIVLVKECDKVKELRLAMNTGESVAVHIRRGDYTAAGFTIERNYYVQAVGCMNQHLANPRYYIFSDDVEWVKSSMGDLFGDCVYMADVLSHSCADPLLRDCEEFALMAQAKHAIIANSTFSWWAALLATNSSKIVIRPKDWKNVYLEGDSNLCPKEWTVI
jgi:Glycosyl transferase family 11